MKSGDFVRIRFEIMDPSDPGIVALRRHGKFGQIETWQAYYAPNNRHLIVMSDGQPVTLMESELELLSPEELEVYMVLES